MVKRLRLANSLAVIVEVQEFFLFVLKADGRNRIETDTAFLSSLLPAELAKI